MDVESESVLKKILGWTTLKIYWIWNRTFTRIPMHVTTICLACDNFSYLSTPQLVHQLSWIIWNDCVMVNRHTHTHTHEKWETMGLCEWCARHARHAPVYVHLPTDFFLGKFYLWLSPYVKRNVFSVVYRAYGNNILIQVEQVKKVEGLLSSAASICRNVFFLSCCFLFSLTYEPCTPTDWQSAQLQLHSCAHRSHMRLCGFRLASPK